MSFRGDSRGRGRGGGFSRGGAGFGGRGGRGGYGQQSYGPPAQIVEMGTFMHACEGEMVCESTNAQVPGFSAQIFLENKTSIGKVDEILGPINQVYFTIKPQEGIQATSFKAGDKFYIGGDRLYPLAKYLPRPKPPPGAAKVKKPAGAGRGGSGGFGGFGGRGGRGAPRGGRGAPRGAPRGRGGFGAGGRGGSGGFGGFGGRGGSGGFSRGRGTGGSRGGFRGRG